MRYVLPMLCPKRASLAAGSKKELKQKFPTDKHERNEWCSA